MKMLNKNKDAVINVNNPLEVIYTDIAGPVHPKEKDGFKYPIELSDEYSGSTFCYCLKQKSDTVKAIEHLLLM